MDSKGKLVGVREDVEAYSPKEWLLWVLSDRSYGKRREAHSLQCNEDDKSIC